MSLLEKHLDFLSEFRVEDDIFTRVGPIYEKFSDQALNWSKVVPWHEKQSEAIIFQLS